MLRWRTTTARSLHFQPAMCRQRNSLSSRRFAQNALRTFPTTFDDGHNEVPGGKSRHLSGLPLRQRGRFSPQRPIESQKVRGFSRCVELPWWPSNPAIPFQPNGKPVPRWKRQTLPFDFEFSVHIRRRLERKRKQLPNFLCGMKARGGLANSERGLEVTTKAYRPQTSVIDYSRRCDESSNKLVLVNN